MTGPLRRIPKWVGWPLLALWTYFVLGYFAESAKFHPSPYPQGPWDIQAQLGAEDVWLTTSDGVQIHGWRIGAGPDVELMTLYLHGNGRDSQRRITPADHRLPRLRQEQGESNRSGHLP